MGATIAPVRDRHRILIVDDIEFNRVVTEAVLINASYEVDCVSDGTAALHAVETKPYDLVLMDLEMPGIDGYRAASEIRRMTGSLKVAALTSRSSPGANSRSSNAGMKWHLSRPIAPQDLVKAVMGILAQGSTHAFRHDIQQEIVKRLGTVRTRAFLVTLLTYCEDAQRAAKAGSEDLDRLVHDLASTAGMLGYEDLSHRCRDILIAPDDSARAVALPRLKVSLSWAIAILREQTGQIEAAA